jgi:hypothetical protein
VAEPVDVPLDELTRSRQLVLGVALLVSALKLVVATSTGGTIDLQHWAEFARGVHQLGPFGVYTGHFPAVYNHPPLIGWWLVGLNWLAAHGVSLRLMIRLPAIVADVVTAILVLELVRTRRGLREARLAGLLVAASPVLVVISGYHGNTDPVFVMLSLLSAYLLGERRAPLWAGLAIGVAISVKLVPVVVLPALLVAAWRGPRPGGLTRFLGGAGAVFAVVWLPAMVTQWSGLRSGVLDYAGSNQGTTQWGLGQILRWLPGQEHTVPLYGGAGRFAVLAACALVPAWFVLRRVAVLPVAVALALCLFLLLTPTFGTQYLAWAAAPAVLLWLPGAAAFTGISTVLLVEAYTRWNHGLPWDQATKWGLDVFAVGVAFLAWLALLVTCWVGALRLRDAGQAEGPAAEQRGLPLRGPSVGPHGDAHASGGVGRGLH